MGDVFIERMVKKKFESTDLLILVGLIVGMIVVVFIGFVIGFVLMPFPMSHTAHRTGRWFWRL